MPIANTGIRTSPCVHSAQPSHHLHPSGQRIQHQCVKCMQMERPMAQKYRAQMHQVKRIPLLPQLSAAAMELSLLARSCHQLQSRRAPCLQRLLKSSLPMPPLACRWQMLWCPKPCQMHAMVRPCGGITAFPTPRVPWTPPRCATRSTSNVQATACHHLFAEFSSCLHPSTPSAASCPWQHPSEPPRCRVHQLVD